ncbi:unnamed protein product [Protopolystoma xenopodis]|uniref:Protein YIF1 n=1 Tax=Protopolystoma xenopodis TaxID=117903 RepID=A0A448WDA1_9PLAT|nr:unnamed protein product [Protopolystoma xenopodis]
MIIILAAFLAFSTPGFYIGLTWTSLSLAFFLIRSLKLQVLPHAEQYPAEGNKRRLYFLLMIALVQPFIMWWLTSTIAYGRWLGAFS